MTTPKVTLVLNSADIEGHLFGFGHAYIFPDPAVLRIPSVEDDLLLENAHAEVYFDGNGAPELDLYPNDLIGPQQGDGSPGWPYWIRYSNCPGDPEPWAFYLLSTNGDRQSLSDLAEAPVVVPGSLSADKHYEIDFTATDSLTVNHNLGKKPSVTVIDSAGDEVFVMPHHVDSNTLTFQFRAAFGGTVICN